MAIRRTYFREKGVSKIEIYLVQLNRNLSWKICIKNSMVKYAERHVYSFYDVRHKIIPISDREIPMFVWREIDKYNMDEHNSKLYKPEVESERKFMY